MRCPIALAVARTTGEVWEIAYVNGWPTHREVRSPIWWPVAVQGFIHTFDAGKPVQPFSFDLEIDDE